MAAIPRLTPDNREQFKLCTFCNASTNGHEKRLFAEPQPKGPYFPILAEIRRDSDDLDELGRSVVCLACFHHLLRQWSSFERRGIPLQKRVYNLITDDRVNNFQHRREDEIRREAEQTLKDIQHREQRIRAEAEEKLKTYQERERQIKHEAERRLCEEQRQVDEVRKEAEKKLRQEQQKEEQIKTQLELRLIEEKEKGDYIRKEAERLLREEKLIDRGAEQQNSQQVTVIKRYRTEVIVPEPSKGNLNASRHLATSAPDLRGTKSNLGEIYVQTEDLDNYSDMASTPSESGLKSQRKKRMEYDPETGCYVRIAAEDAPVEGSDKGNSHLNGSASRKGTPSRVSAVGDISVKSKKATDSSKVPSKTAGSSDTSSRKDSIERRRKETERRRAQLLVRGGDASKPSGATSKARPKSEPNLDTKLKEMEQRRARMFLHGKSGGDKSAARNAADPKPLMKTDNSKTSPTSEDSKSPDDARKNKKRTREERNRRRLSAEAINLRKSAGEDVLSPREKEAKGDDKENEPNRATEDVPRDHVTSPSDSPTKPGEKAVKVEYVWNGKEVTRVEIPVGTSRKEQEEELSKVGKPIKGYLKKDSDDDKMSDEEPMELKVSAEEKTVKHGDPKISEELLNLESAAEGTSDGHAQVEKMEEEPPTHAKPLYEEPDKERTSNPTKNANADFIAFDQPVDLMDGPGAQSLDDFVAETLGEFRTRADSSEGETYPHADKLVLIETTIELNRNVEVQSAPATELSPSPVIETISAGNQRTNGRETIDEERRRKRKEQEEKRRRIEENQRRAAMEKKLREEGRENTEHVVPVVRREKASFESSWDAAEKRRSLQDLWETMASPSSCSSDEVGGEQVRMVIETEVRSAPNTEGLQLSPREEGELEEEARKMDVEETQCSPSFNGVDNEKHKLSEEELRWETAGHFQPGKLKSRFHEMAKDAPVLDKPQARPKQQGRSRYDWMKNEELADQELLVPHKLNVNLEAKQTEETDDSRKSQDQLVESQAKPLWEDNVDVLNHQNETFGENESDSEDERRPRAERDEYHKLTEEELRWEGAGQFQPSKLNKSLFTEFDKRPSASEERPKVTKHAPNTKMLGKVSKQDVAVSFKLDPEENRPTHVTESEHEQGDRPSVGRLQEFRTHDFEEEDEIPSADAKRRQFEEERRRTELEEIERAKEEERKRREREDQEEAQEKDFPDDEFELKVKTKAVNKIDRSLFGQFLQEDRKEDEIPRRRKPQQKKPTQVETVTVTETIEVVETEPEESVPYEDERESSVTVIKETDVADDEFERKVLEKKIGKINLRSSPFHGTREEVPYSSQRKNPEAKKTDGVAFAQEESVPVADTIEIVESEPVQYAPSDELSSDEVSSNKDFGDDPFERKVQEKKIGKINLSSSPFLNSNKTEEPLPDTRRKRKEESRREEETGEEDERFVVERTVIEVARERPAETPPVANENDFEDDEFELKVKKKEVKKLNLAQFEFKQRELEDKEQRLRQLEEERRKTERQEKELLKKEEERRRLHLQAEARAKAEEEERIRQAEEELEALRENDRPDYGSNVEVTIEDSIKDNEPKSVGKIDITKFSQFQQGTVAPPKPPRTYEVDVAQASQEPAIQSVAVNEIESAPDFEALENGDEDVDYEEKRKDVGRLNKDWYFRQQQQEAEEAQRKAKYLEEERLRLEREEIERSRQEERFKISADAGEVVPVTFEQDSPDKPSNVGKLNLDKFSQFQQSSSPPINTQRQRVDVDRKPKAEPREVVVASNVVEVESSPCEADFEVDSSDKPRSVGKLGQSHVAMFNKSEANPRAPTPDTSRSGSSEARPGRPPTLAEPHTKEVTLLPSSPPDVEEEDYEERLKNVKKLDVDRFIQSRRDESVERENRKKQLEVERLRREKREMEERREEESRRKQYTASDQVDSGVILTPTSGVQINGSAEHDEKPKSVGRLNFDQFSQFQKADTTKEKAKQEQKPNQGTRRSEERPRRYVIEPNDEAQPYKDINHNITYTHSTSRTPEGSGDKDKARMDDQNIARSDSSAVKITPKRLSRDMFDAFGGSKKDQTAPMRRAKSEMQLNPKDVTIVERKAWQDDDAVVESRRRKDSRDQKRRARPKSIAFIDTSMFEN